MYAVGLTKAYNAKETKFTLIGSMRRTDDKIFEYTNKLGRHSTVCFALLVY